MILGIDELCKKVHDDAEEISIDFLNDGNDEELRTIFVYLVYDISGSMNKHSKTMYESFISTCRALTSAQNEDYNYKVKLVLFNKEVNEFNKEFQSPDDLMELVSEKEFKCDGSTSLGKIIEYLDNQFTREALKNRHMASSDPKSLVIMITDYYPTDAEDIRRKATNRILANRFYKKVNQTLCIYCGDDKHKADAAELAGSLDNIVALGTDIALLLTPVIINSTITLSDATHISGEASEYESPSEIAERVIDRTKKNQESVAKMDDEAIKDELSKLFGI